MMDSAGVGGRGEGLGCKLWSTGGDQQEVGVCSVGNRIPKTRETFLTFHTV